MNANIKVLINEKKNLKTDSNVSRLRSVSILKLTENPVLYAFD